MTEIPVPNPSMLKMGGVALAGYVLGRMKKGRAAVGLAMWAAGVKADPKALIRQGLLTLANSDEGKELLMQLRGPMLQAGRKAAGATIEGQVAALTSALQKRTEKLNERDEADGESEAEEDERDSDTDEYDDDYDDSAEDTDQEEDEDQDEEASDEHAAPNQDESEADVAEDDEEPEDESDEDESEDEEPEAAAET